jgi:ATP-binding cassette subfamily C (CFTR/MRP) protein 1
LPYADKIIALGTDGKISAQGTFDELNAEGGYLRRFDLSSRTDSGSKESEVNESQSTPLAKAEEPLAKVVNDEVRRLGDRSVYKYYFQSIGLVNTLIFFLILLIWIFMLKFPGMKTLSILWTELIFLACRNLA